MRLAAAGVLLGVTMLLAQAASGGQTRTYSVARVIDGDTIALTTGQRVRLVQIDAPELSGGECFSAGARAALASLLPARSAVRLEFDPKLDRVDRYGRLLAYVRKGEANVNRVLVARGAARRGLWKACPTTRLDPSHAIETGQPATTSSRCDASYPDVCIPPPPPDLDCADIARKVRVAGADPHRLDGDGDGWGCESYG
jgi:micrococcal nuclease